MLLAIDTSAGTSVAVVDRDGGILAERSQSDTMRHAEVIGELIDAVLRESGVAVAALSGVAAGMGPGPFTGLRVGIAAAKAFAFGAHKPLVPCRQPRRRRVRAVRRRPRGRPAGGDGCPPSRAVLVGIRRRRRSRPADPRRTAPGWQSPTRCRIRRSNDSTRRQVSAGALGMLAELLYANGRQFAADEPLYLRSPDVTLSNGPKRVSA